jgi:flagellar biosynthetic protein FlhB
LANDAYGERTESATPKRREEARGEGKVARSTELTNALALLAGVAALSFLGGRLMQRLSDLFRSLLSTSPSGLATEAGVYFTFQQLALQITVILAPLLISLIAVGLASNVLQVGFMLTGKPISPRWSLIDPVEGFKRILSLRSVTELLKSILKVSIIGLIAWVTLKSDLDRLVPLTGADGPTLVGQVGAATVRLGLRVGLALLVLGILDYGYQRWEYERSIRMSRQELEEEQKQTEGDPQVKARVRVAQRLLARRRMMVDVAKADVVVTNPTHYAVALKYDRPTMPAPLVVAKGMRKLAERIKEVAKENRVPVVEDPPLARLLYKECEVGSAIPVSVYQAVARVLAYVWKLRGRTQGGRVAA